MVGVAFGEYRTVVDEQELPDLCSYAWLLGQRRTNPALRGLTITWRCFYHFDWEPLVDRVLLDVVHRM